MEHFLLHNKFMVLSCIKIKIGDLKDFKSFWQYWTRTSDTLSIALLWGEDFENKGYSPTFNLWCWSLVEWCAFDSRINDNPPECLKEVSRRECISTVTNMLIEYYSYNLCKFRKHFSEYVWVRTVIWGWGSNLKITWSALLVIHTTHLYCILV